MLLYFFAIHSRQKFASAPRGRWCESQSACRLCESFNKEKKGRKGDALTVTYVQGQQMQMQLCYKLAECAEPM